MAWGTLTHTQMAWGTLPTIHTHTSTHITYTQIKVDCDFLHSIGVMDYSLLLGVHHRGRSMQVCCIRETASAREREGAREGARATARRDGRRARESERELDMYMYMYFIVSILAGTLHTIHICICIPYISAYVYCTYLHMYNSYNVRVGACMASLSKNQCPFGCFFFLVTTARTLSFLCTTLSFSQPSAITPTTT